MQPFDNKNYNLSPTFKMASSSTMNFNIILIEHFLKTVKKERLQIKRKASHLPLSSRHKMIP